MTLSCRSTTALPAPHPFSCQEAVLLDAHSKIQTSGLQGRQPWTLSPLIVNVPMRGFVGPDLVVASTEAAGVGQKELSTVRISLTRTCNRRPASQRKLAWIANSANRYRSTGLHPDIRRHPCSPQQIPSRCHLLVCRQANRVLC